MHTSQACSFKPPKGGVIIPILLIKDESTVVRSLIPSQMADKGPHRQEPDCLACPQCGSPQCAHLTALPTAPVSPPSPTSHPSLAQLYQNSLRSPVLARPMLEVLRTPVRPTGDSFLEPPSPSMSSRGFPYAPAAARGTLFTTVCKPPPPHGEHACLVSLSPRPSALLHLPTHRTTDRGGWTLPRLRSPHGQLFVSLPVSSKQGKVTSL